MGCEDQGKCGLKSWILRGINLGFCLILLAFLSSKTLGQNIAPSSTIEAVYVFPNPVTPNISSKIHLELKDPKSTDTPFSIRVYDVAGQIIPSVSADRSMETSDEFSVDMPLKMGSLQPGVYVGVVNVGDTPERATFKFSVLQ